MLEKAALAATPTSWRWIEDKAVAKKYGVLGLPVTVIIDKAGKIVFRGSRPPKTFDFTK
ncbi:MAG: hypothetical protein HY952_06110 [Elusimicrobia bacterium]|nr:hypothetical protein [Elusimicrobiota bacterium]